MEPPKLETKAAPLIFPFRKTPSKVFSSGVPDPVGQSSHHQYKPPEGQLNSHPEFPSLKAPRFRENFGSGNEDDI
jgi:hypothetical protein